MSVAARLLPVVAVVAAAAVRVAGPAAAADGPAVLTLADGGSTAGTLLGSDDPGTVRWQASPFTSPFEFDAAAVSSVAFPAAAPAGARGEFSLELAAGDVLSGRLRGWTDEAVTLESPRFGTLSVRRRAVRRLYRIDENPTLVFSGPTGLAGWADVAGWREDGPHLRADAEGAALTGDFELPDKAVIEFELSWEKDPDFVFAVGVDGRSKADSRLDGWRFETWGAREKTLALVCERREAADVAAVETLPAVRTSTPRSSRRPALSGFGIFGGANPARASDETEQTRPRDPEGSPPAGTPPAAGRRLHLIAFLDQSAGSLKVYRPDGSLAAEVAVAPPDPDFEPRPKNGTVRLINRGGDLRLERLRVARWNGVPPQGGEGGSRFDLADGGVVAGEVTGLRDDGADFVLRADDGERAVPVRDVVAAELPAEPAGGVRPVTAVLRDGTRVSGGLDGFAADEVVLISPDVTEPLRIAHAELRSLTFAPPAAPEGGTPPKPDGRPGRLAVDGQTLFGVLTDASESPEASCLSWRPAGSRTASPLKPSASGRIFYREPPLPPVRLSATAGAFVRIQPQMNAGGRRPSAILPSRAKRRDGPPHDVHLRSGDVVPCTIVAIDEQGVHVTSPVAAATVVPHASVKAVEFAAGSLPDLRAAKKDRLLTVPRAQRDSPPTHLLHSPNGDLLRCRLVALTEESVRVEIHLAEVDIPRARVARIIWFHEDEVEAEDETANRADPAGAPSAGSPLRGEPFGSDDGVNRAYFDPKRYAPPQAEPAGPTAAGPVEAPMPRRNRQLVQILRPDGNRTTFDADVVEGQVIAGTSLILGECRFDLTQADQLVFGVRIEAAVEDLPYTAWRLRRAVEPLVAQEFDGLGGDTGTASPLFGQPAPDVALELLDGGSFRLSQCRGQIVVLDFWATWCGPCIQTMPLTERAIAEFDPAAVRLVAVNLEEPADQIRAVMERHDLRMPVALDIDGVAARRYQADAIPQVVVVDRDGKVARVFVGGGSEAVEQLKSSLRELLTGENPPPPGEEEAGGDSGGAGME